MINLLQQRFLQKCSMHSSIRVLPQPLHAFAVRVGKDAGGLLRGRWFGDGGIGLFR